MECLEKFRIIAPVGMSASLKGVTGCPGTVKSSEIAPKDKYFMGFKVFDQHG
jgi:hypothetical protein